ncbi:MAG: beta-ketoacyl-ACP synthase III, partial [Myxococcales bacterium]|nr:beta-ketoacyl-ACP synthase III [Myxococcales bacterium]
MTAVAITGTGVFTPEAVITNAELVASFNEYARRFNAANAAAIERGEVAAKPMSSEEFILKASGIERRYVLD